MVDTQSRCFTDRHVSSSFSVVEETGSDCFIQSSETNKWWRVTQPRLPVSSTPWLVVSYKYAFLIPLVGSNSIWIFCLTNLVIKSSHSEVFLKYVTVSRARRGRIVKRSWTTCRYLILFSIWYYFLRIHLFNKYLWLFIHMLGILLGASNVAVEKIDKNSCLHSRGGEQMINPK